MKVLPKNIWKAASLLVASFGCVISGFAQDSLVVDSVVASNRNGLENILQGNVAGLRIKSWSATPGAQAVLNLRGLSLDPTDQSTMPLVLINGVPMIAGPSNITGINPLGYFSPDQIERIEVIKDIDRLAAFGVQAPNGALNIVIKEGKRGPIHVRANAFAGANFLQGIDYRKDAFYNFNTTGRRAVYGNGAVVDEQNLVVDGGGDYGSYLFGLSNYQDRGTIKASDFGRQSLFLNAQYHVSPKFSAQFYNNLALANRNGRYAGEYNRSLLLPVVNDESFFMDKNRNISLLSSMSLTYRFHPGLAISSVAGLSYEGASRDVYVPSAVLDGNIFASSAAYKRQLITINTSLKYTHAFSDALNLDMTLGNQLRTTDNKLTSVDGQRSLENGGSDYVKIVTGYNAQQTNALSDHEMEKLFSFYGTWNWTYKKDLDVNMVLRTDGSSLYDKKWALYPALGVHYRLDGSLHLPVTLNASLGKTGILSRPETYRGELAAYGDYYSGNELGIGQLYPAFTDARSVGVYQADAGLSVDLHRSLKLSVNYFHKTYTDFTYQRYLPNINGTDYQYETGGSIGLSGWEANIEGRWLNTRNFSWSTNLNVAAYRNKVNELPHDVSATSLTHLAALSVGDALTSLVAYEGKQQKVIGNSEAKAFGGLSNQFRFKDLSVGMTLSYAWGADVVAESFSSQYTADQVAGTFPLKTAETPYYFMNKDANGRTVYQGIRTIEDGSFIRLNKVAVAYRLGSLFKRFSTLTDMELFARGENLLTLSKYSGLNPEENITGIRSTNLGTTGTPLASSVVLGLKLIF